MITTLIVLKNYTSFVYVIIIIIIIIIINAWNNNCIHD